MRAGGTPPNGVVLPDGLTLPRGGMLAAVRQLLDEAVLAYPDADAVRQSREQLDGPLRVAFAGRLKAGKSTLLNALVGESLAATDATECTRVVTWYLNGPATRAWAYPKEGPPEQVRFSRNGGATHIELGRFEPLDLERLVVETPNSRLRQLSLVDTPGLASSSTEVSAQTQALLVDDGPGVDAVLYLMRHMHSADVGFLQSFHDDQFAGTAPVNAIGVLARADEMAGGQPNALDVAGTIAQRYSADGRVRALVQTVVPVSGLLALAAVGLTESQFTALAQVAGGPASAMLSADRFLRAHDGPPDQQQRLLSTFGLFGIRHSVALIRLGRAADAGQLARILRAECGLERLRALLVERFVGRAGLLKAEAALRLIESTLEQQPVTAGDQLRSRIEAVLAGAHELVELRTITALRTGALELDSTEQQIEAERLLGADGETARIRLGLEAGAPDPEVRSAVVRTIQRWQRLAQNPFAGSGTRRLAGIIRRSCEGLLSSPARTSAVGSAEPLPDGRSGR